MVEEEMTVDMKLLHPEAKTPTKAHEDDFGYDVVATSCEEVGPNVYKYGLGIALDPTAGIDKYVSNYYTPAFMLFPRSSIYKRGMVLSNAVGIIDIGYRNEISAVFYHVVPTLPKYEVGERIGQIVFLEHGRNLQFRVTDTLSESERGMGGYGSTGK